MPAVSAIEVWTIEVLAGARAPAPSATGKGVPINVTLAISTATMFMRRLTGPVSRRSSLIGHDVIVMSLWGQFAVGDLDQALNEAWLMAEGMRLVSANGPESGPAAVSIGELSPVHRALLDLSLIDDVPIDVVARIASIPSAEVGDALVDAQRLFARGFAGVPLDDFLRADEKWLDDDMRRMCRDRVANPQRPQRQAASAGKAVRPARLGDGRRNSRLTMFVSIAVVGVLLGIGALWVRPHNSASEANSAATLVAASGARRRFLRPRRHAGRPLPVSLRC